MPSQKRRFTCRRGVAFPGSGDCVEAIAAKCFVGRLRRVVVMTLSAATGAGFRERLLPSRAPSPDLPRGVCNSGACSRSGVFLSRLTGVQLRRVFPKRRRRLRRGKRAENGATGRVPLVVEGMIQRPSGIRELRQFMEMPVRRYAVRFGPFTEMPEFGRVRIRGRFFDRALPRPL